MAKKQSASSAPVKRTAKNVKHIPDNQIDYSDIPASTDANLVSETLLECIKTGDLESFREVLVAHLMSANNSEIAKIAGVGRRTIYDIIDIKKDFNPELSTASAIIRALAA